MIIGQVVYEALQRAQADKRHEFDRTQDLGPLRRSWSQHFVACLAHGLRDQYPERDKVAVMSKDFPIGPQEERERVRKWIRAEFGMFELLYDISVFEYHSVRATDERKKLSAVRSGLWSVESEMENDSRHALYDFNKLVLSSSESKLFVGPLLGAKEQDGYMKSLGESAAHAQGELYMALIPPPKKWPDSNADSMQLYSWTNRAWLKIWPAT